MKRASCVVAISLPLTLTLSLALLTGAARPPFMPAPQQNHAPAVAVPEKGGNGAEIIEVDFFDRLFRDGRTRNNRPSAYRRAAKAKNATPAVPPLATIPVPQPKPGDNAGAAVTPKDATAAPANPDTPATAAPSTPPVATPPAPPSAATTPEPKAQDKTAADTAKPAHEPAKDASPSAAQQQTPDPDQPPRPASGPTPKPASNAASTPTTAPLVQQPATGSEPAHTTEVPTPLEKPLAGGAQTGPDKEKTAPDGQQDGQNDGKQPEASPAPPPLVVEDPDELKACLADLQSMGTKFTAVDPINEGDGCGIEKPIDVAEVLPGISTGNATMRCKTAQSLAHWLKDTVQPAMNIAMPGRHIVGITPGSTYACRLRNNASTGKISEHARGNAFDVAAFTFDNGEKMELTPRQEDSTMEGAFQRTITAGACLHFTTVLSPGSDAAHETHLHLDVIERKGGYRYCR